MAKRALFTGRSHRRWLAAALLLVGVTPFSAGAQSSQAETEDEESQVSNVVRPPELLSSREITYPDGATGAHEVALKILVQADGSVGEVEVVEGEEPFAAAAREAALGFRFAPARQGDTPRAAWILYRIAFEPPLIEEQDVQSNRAQPNQDHAKTEPEEEVTVQGVRRPGVGRIMSDAETQIIPGAEGDPVRSIEAMPGTVPILASGPFLGLRGASPGMVGYEFDGIALPYLFHLARGPTVIHPWMVSSAAIHSGGSPARLGRALGGFVEATAALPEGRNRYAARVRLTDTALGVEAPFAGGKGSALVAGRYSYTRPMVSLIAPEFRLNYWDYQTRIRYALTPKDHLEVLTFGAGDRSSVDLPDEPFEDLFFASLHRAAIRYTRHRGGGAHHRIGVTVGHDRWDGRPSPIRPFLYTVNLQASSVQPVSQRSWVEVGADGGVRFQTDYYTIGPPEDVQVNRYTRDDVMAGTWLDWTYAASETTTMALGVRADLYSSTATDNRPAATAGALQPRLSLSQQVGDLSRLHSSAGVLAAPRSPAQRPPGRIASIDGGLEWAALSDIGMEFQLPANFTFDTTVFHNTFFNVGDIEHLRFIRNQNFAEERGRGQAYGLEVSLRRMLARHLRGFVSYTLSRSWRSIGRVRGLAEFDRPHVVDVALAYDFGRGWSLTSRGTYYRGYPARMARVDSVDGAPRASDHYQVDWQAAKRWDINEAGGWWGLTLGVLNTNFRSESNAFFCDVGGRCEEELVGPASIPTFGIEGEL